MPVIKIDPQRPDPLVIGEAVQYLRKEFPVIHPTETVYGFAGLYDSESVIRKVLDLKGRRESQPFSIMVSDIETLFSLSGQTSPHLADFLNKILPGALTVLLPRKKILKLNFWNHYPFLGFRFPDHPLSLNLIQAAEKPLITTSVNISGEPPACRIEEVPSEIRQKVPLILDGGKTPRQIPSTIIEIQPDLHVVKLIRPGALPWSEIEKHIAHL